MPLAVNQGLRFNGLTDSVQLLPTNKLLMTDAVSIDISFSCSIVGATQTILSRNGPYAISYLSAIGRVQVAIFAGGTWTTVTSNLTFAVGQRIRVTLVYDSTSAISLYLNGVLDTVTPKTGLMGSIGRMFLGYPPDVGYQNPFFGTIENVHIYNRALSASEVAANYTGQVTRSGLVGEWLFQEGQGTTATDTSGNGNNGTITGATWLIQKSQPGMRFNGLTDYVQVQDSSSLHISGSITLESLFIPKSTSSGTIFWKQNQFAVELSGGSITYADNTTWNFSVVGTYGNVLINQINHVAVTFDGTNIQFYLNGSLVKTLSRSGSLTSNTNPLIFGVEQPGGNNPFNGFIIRNRIYNRALSASEVAANYTGQVTRTGLVGEWLMKDDGSGKVTDTSGSGNHGTINGASFLQRHAPQKPKKNMLPSFKSGQWTIHANAVVNSDYSLTLNATAASQRSGVAVNVIPNAQYTISSAVGSSTFYFNIRDTNNVGTLIATTGVSGTTFTAPASGIVYIETTNTATSGTFTFTNPQLEQGSTATAFEAYQLINDIKPTRMKPKKNFIPTDPTAWELSGIDFFSGLNADNTARIRTKDYTPCVPLQIYTLTCGSYWIGAIWYDKNKNYVGSTNTQVASGSTISVPYNAWFFRFSLKRSDNSIISDLSDIPIAKPQLEQGSTATAWEAYTLIPDVKLALR